MSACLFFFFFFFTFKAYTPPLFFYSYYCCRCRRFSHLRFSVVRAVKSAHTVALPFFSIKILLLSFFACPRSFLCVCVCVCVFILVSQR